MSKTAGKTKETTKETQTEYIAPEVIIKPNVDQYDMFDLETRVRELVMEAMEPLAQGFILDRERNITNHTNVASLMH